MELVEFVRAVVKSVNERMRFGEAACPFCKHHYNHDANCLYIEARRILAQQQEREVDKPSTE